MRTEDLNVPDGMADVRSGRLEAVLQEHLTRFARPAGGPQAAEAATARQAAEGPAASARHTAEELLT
jgi:hypothetical protein